MAHRKPLKAKNWKNYLRDCGATGLICYVEATQELINSLEKTTKTKQDFNSLKEELMKFTDERRQFINHIKDKWKMDM